MFSCVHDVVSAISVVRIKVWMEFYAALWWCILELSKVHSLRSQLDYRYLKNTILVFISAQRKKHRVL